MLKRGAFDFPYAYVLHNRDLPKPHCKLGKKFTLTARKFKPFKSKIIYKKPHYHFLWITKNKRSAKSAGQFFGGLINPKQVQICHDLQSYYNYMEHTDITSQIQHKHPYPNKRKSYNNISSYIDIKGIDNNALMLMQSQTATEDYLSLCLSLKRPPNLYDLTQYVIANCPECLATIVGKAFYFNTAIIGFLNANMQYFNTYKEIDKIV